MAELLKHYFSSPKLQAAIAWMSVQSGTTLDEPFGAMMRAWFVTYHLSGAAHPRGGVGELTQSLVRLIREYGGQVVTNAEVSEIIVGNGRVSGVRLKSREIVSTSRVVSAVHIQTTLRLINAFDAPLRKRIEQLNLGNGMGMALRLAVSELPRYTSYSRADSSQHRALQLLMPDLQYLRKAH